MFLQCCLYVGSWQFPKKYYFPRFLWISASKLWITPVQCGELAQLFGNCPETIPPDMGGVFYPCQLLDWWIRAVKKVFGEVKTYPQWEQAAGRVESARYGVGQDIKIQQ